MKSAAEVLKENCFIEVGRLIDDHEKTYISGMIQALCLNDVITPSEAHAARELIKAIWGGMHPELRYFYK